MDNFTLKRFVRDVEKNFGPPFLPEGFVTCRVLPNGGLLLAIGRRDVSWDAELTFGGAGTDLLSKWDISVSDKSIVIPRRKARKAKGGHS